MFTYHVYQIRVYQLSFFSAAITLNITGYAETRWIERVTINRRRRRRTFYGREDYVASKTFLVGSNLSSSYKNHSTLRTFAKY